MKSVPLLRILATSLLAFHSLLWVNSGPHSVIILSSRKTSQDSHQPMSLSVQNSA